MKAVTSHELGEIADAVSTLFKYSDNGAAEELEALALKQGWLIRCECGWNVPVTDRKCENCREKVGRAAPPSSVQSSEVCPECGCKGYLSAIVACSCSCHPLT